MQQITKTSDISELMRKGPKMLRKKARIIRLDGNNDEKFYSKRVVRNSCFLGVDEEQQKQSQDRLANAVVGVAGAGGLGSYLAEQLARVGVRHIKIADPDHFEESNINRQNGAGLPTIGRNKALTVGEIVHKNMPDVTVEIFPEGIQRHTAEAFVEGTDLVYDCTDFYLVDERYALHRAYLNHSRTKTMLCGCVWGWGSAVYRFDRNGLTYEELIGLKEGEDLTPEKIDTLVRMQANYLPRYPSKKTIYGWMEDVGNIPILGAIPPICCGILTAQGVMMLCDLDREPYSVPLPPIPEYYWVDVQELSAGIYKFDGTWVNENNYEKHFERESA
jgi:molybdopterin/thiamine biosynthesis adenylyltransferase